MENFQFLKGYIADDAKRESLYPLFDKVFGIEPGILREFYMRGLWSREYMPYTFFDGESAVSNVSAFPLLMQIDGRQRKCAGIQSVMTLPEYRGRGLMKRLFAEMLEELDETADGSFLYTSTPELYIPFGFEAIPQVYYRIETKMLAPKKPMKKLDPYLDEDVILLRELLPKHEPVSNMFAPIGHEHPFYFNLYRPQVGGSMYWIEELQTIVVFERFGETIRLYDIISETIPDFVALCSYLGPFSSVELYFSPDLLSLDRTEALPFEDENVLMFKGSFPLPGAVFMPLTAEF